MFRKISIIGGGLMLIFGMAVPVVPNAKAAEIRDILFPVLGGVSYSSTFGAPRVGHTHEGNDIFAPKGRGVVSTVDGEIRWVAFPQPSWGWGVEIEGEDGWRYRYLHLNNDTPGTDDGQGGGRGAYATGMIDGAPIKRGQLIGYVGDSGNAETTTPHLHFEIRTPDGVAVDPYPSLQAAAHIITPVPRDPLPDEFFPYGPFMGGANITVGNVAPESSGEEVITGAMPGAAPHVRIFDGDGAFVSQFYAYAQSFRGGVDVAAGDVDGDGIAEIITGTFSAGAPSIRVLRKDGTQYSHFIAYAQDSRHGVRVAAADLTGDGIAEIITAPGSGGAPHIKVFNGIGGQLVEFTAYLPGFRGGVDVAAYKATSTTPALIVTGAGPTGGPHVRMFTPNGTLYGQFFPYDPAFRGGVRVSITNQDSGILGPEIYVAPASKGGPNFRVHSTDGQFQDRVRGFEEWWVGGYDIAAGAVQEYASSGPDGRPVSVWELD